MSQAVSETADAAPAPAQSAPEAARPTGFKAWVKRRETPAARLIYGLAMGARGFSMPVIPGVHRGLYAGSRLFWRLWATFMRVFWHTPLLRSRIETPARRMQLTEGLPAISGPLRIRIGDGCRVSGVMTWTGRSASAETPLLEVGDNVDLGWGGTLAVGRRIIIGNNVRLAPSVTLSGYPGHPLDAAARAAHAPCTEDQVGDIVLEDDVWLGQRVMVTPGVTIGRGTVVGMGSVVTKDLPAGVLAAGVPARPLRAIAPSEDRAALADAEGSAV